MRKRTKSKFDEITTLGNIAVKITRQENWEKGLPNVESKSGKVCYRLSNGQTVNKYDWKNKS